MLPRRLSSPGSNVQRSRLRVDLQPGDLDRLIADVADRDSVQPLGGVSAEPDLRVGEFHCRSSDAATDEFGEGCGVLLRGAATDEERDQLWPVRGEDHAVRRAVVGTHLGDDLTRRFIGDEEGGDVWGIGDVDLGEASLAVLEPDFVDDHVVPGRAEPVDGGQNVGDVHGEGQWSVTVEGVDGGRGICRPRAYFEVCTAFQSSTVASST